MSLTKKFAAFGVAAALSATGLVGATGTSAQAAGAPTYDCKIKLATGESGSFSVPLNFAVPSPTAGSTIKKGTVVSGSADMSDLFAKAAGGDATLKMFVDALNGEGPGAALYGDSLNANGLTVTPGPFDVWAAGVQKLPFALQTETIPGSQLGALKTAQALPVKAAFTGDQAVTFPAGTYDLNLPDDFSLALSTGTDSIGSVDCAGTGQVAKLVVKPQASESAALKAAKAQLAKDKAALAKAKKALKKAKGHKKVVLKKKVAKLVKKVKADQAKVNSLS